MFTVVRAFLCDRTGVVAQITVLSTGLLLGLSGAVVDGSGYYYAQYRLQAAADATALAAAKAMVDNSLSIADTQAYALGYLQNLLPTQPTPRDPDDHGTQTAPAPVPVVWVDGSRSRVRVEISGRYPTYLVQFLGVSGVDLYAQADAAPPPHNLDIVLAVDNTSWVNKAYDSRLDDVRAYLHAFADYIYGVNDLQSPGQMRLALVPFANGVNPGVYGALAANGVPLDPAGRGGQRCLCERLPQNGAANPFQSTDMPPVGFLRLSNPSDLPKTTQAANDDANCPVAPVLPLTSADQRRQFDSAVDMMTVAPSSNGLSSGHLALAWAHYMLSDIWGGRVFPASAAVQPPDANNSRVVIMFTASPLSSFMGTGTSTSASAAAIDAATNTCKDMQTGGTRIFVIALAANPSDNGISDNVPAPNDTQTALRSCALTQTPYGEQVQLDVVYDGPDIDAAIRRIVANLRSVILVGG